MIDPAPVLTRAPFWFLRHGQTDWNKDSLAQGSTDIPLNQTGIDQARAAADLLAGHGIAGLVCSPLRRARATADIVAAKLEMTVTEEPLLHEASFGVMEARPMLAPWFADWVAGRATPEGAEPFADVIHRAVTAVNRALATNPAPLLVVAHGAFFRALRAAMGLDPAERLMNAIPLRCEPGAAGGAWRPVPIR